MSTATVTIRELRIDFRSVKRKIEEHGHVVITDNGVPSFEIKPLAKPAAKFKPAPMPDYYARVIRRQPKGLTEEEARRFHEENRGDC
jgi:antitoxin (DNA-binding transcriptional repressor) of toxin-antitoxin stability system